MSIELILQKEVPRKIFTSVESSIRKQIPIILTGQTLTPAKIFSEVMSLCFI